MVHPIDRAVKLVGDFHRGQVDKSGRPYILHPMAVALMMETDDEIVVAILYDVVEDINCELSDLCGYHQFSDRVVDVVDAISQRKSEETYKEYIHRCIQNDLAKRVKKADVLHNMSPARQNHPDAEGLAERYVWTLKQIGKIENE